MFYDGANLKPGLFGRAVVAGDFNEDGIDDIVTSHAYTQTKNLALKIRDRLSPGPRDPARLAHGTGRIRR